MHCFQSSPSFFSRISFLSLLFIFSGSFFFNSNSAYSASIVIDHTCTDVSKIPDSWIAAVKAANFITQYVGESHSRQMIYGLQFLQAQNSKYKVQIGSSITALTDTTALKYLCARRDVSSWTDGAGEQTYWATEAGRQTTERTASYCIAQGKPLVFSIFAWCWDIAESNWCYNEAGTSLITYNDERQQALENAMIRFNTNSAINRTKFIYHTAVTDVSNTSPGSWRVTYYNNRIRQAAAANGGILFDQADIENWNPAGTQQRITTYNGNTCYIRHLDYDETYGVGADTWTGDHARDNLCLQKAKAFWWLSARIAGWDGNPASSTPVNTPTNTATNTPTNTPTNTRTSTPTIKPTNTPMPTSTATAVPTNTATTQPTQTPVPPTQTPKPTSTNTAIPPTKTPVPAATNTPIPPTQTPTATATKTPIPPTRTPIPTSTNTVTPPTQTPINSSLDMPAQSPSTPIPTVVNTPIPTSIPDSILFLNGYENGNFAKWSSTQVQGNGGILVQSAVIHSGRFAMKSSIPMVTGWSDWKKSITNKSFSTLGSRPNPLYSRIYFMLGNDLVAPLGRPVTIATIDTNKNWGYISLNIKNVNNKYVLAYVLNWGVKECIGVTEIRKGQWYGLECKYKSGATDGEIRIFLDGKEEIASTALNLSTVDSLSVGLMTNSPGAIGSVYLDDVAIASQYIGLIDDVGSTDIPVPIPTATKQPTSVPTSTPIPTQVPTAIPSPTAKPDTDQDGIPDELEITLYKTDPNNPDTDGDGINDGQELTLWGDQWSLDYDGDGLSNLLDADNDEDGFFDTEEVAQGYNPFDAKNHPTANQIWLEAEAGTLNSPMTTVNDSTASGGQYIWVPTGRGEVTDPSQNGGYAVYTVNVPADGFYTLWWRVMTPTASADPFYVSVNNGKFDPSMSIQPGWTWKRFSGENTTVPQVYALQTGLNTFKIKQRNDGIKIDKLMLCNDWNFFPKAEGAAESQ